MGQTPSITTRPGGFGIPLFGSSGESLVLLDFRAMVALTVRSSLNSPYRTRREGRAAVRADLFGPLDNHPGPIVG
jgi:hypothetical protein